MPYAGCVDALARSVRVELEHISAIRFRLIIRDVRIGAHRDVHLFAVVRKCETPSPMPPAARDTGDYGCGGATRFQIAIPIRKPDHGIRISDVNVLWIRSRGVESDSVRQG